MCSRRVTPTAGTTRRRSSSRGPAGREAAQAVVDRLQQTLGIGLMIQQRAAVPEADVILILGKDFPDSLPIF